MGNLSFSRDPLLAVEGVTVEFKPKTLRMRHTGPIPDTAYDWGRTKGIVCAFGVRSSDGDAMVGSAVMVAPGLAITARHVTEPYDQALATGEAFAHLTAYGPEGLASWIVTGVNRCYPHDIAYLTVHRSSALPADRTINYLVMTTRHPLWGIWRGRAARSCPSPR